MFWRAKSPLESDDEEWQLATWGWLLRHFGGVARMRERRLILPTRDFFTPPKAEGHAAALAWFAQTAAWFDVDPAQFELVAQRASINPVIGPAQIVMNAPSDPLGTFSFGQEGVMSVSYNPALVAKPFELVATFAHEICHPLLLSIPEEPPAGPEMEEFATDLAVTFFGFGVFSSNTASMFRQYRDDATGMQGWSMEGQGYLSPAERAFALALFVHDRPDDKRIAREHLEIGPRAYFDKAAKYLSANPAILANLVAESV